MATKNDECASATTGLGPDKNLASELQRKKTHDTGAAYDPACIAARSNCSQSVDGTKPTTNFTVISGCHKGN